MTLKMKASKKYVLLYKSERAKMSTATKRTLNQKLSPIRYVCSLGVKTLVENPDRYSKYIIKTEKGVRIAYLNSFSINS